MKHNQDYEELDLEALPEDFIPRTSYQPNRSLPYDQDYTHWEIDGRKVAAGADEPVHRRRHLWSLLTPCRDTSGSQTYRNLTRRPISSIPFAVNT